MLRQSLRCCQHSMKKDLLKRKHYGDRYQWLCNVLLLGLLCCAFLPNGVGATCDGLPNGCVSVVAVKTDAVKYQNISCTNLDILTVPCIGKEASAVLKFDLSDNLITSLAADDWLYFYNLRDLDLSNNPISSIHLDSFNNLTNLQRLSLAGNNFATLDVDIFEDTPLQFLNISNLELLILEKTFFNNLDALKEVDISHNNISVLYDNLFKKTALQSIDLSWNLLSDANIRAYRSVLTLNLSHNLITTVGNHFLDDADSLTNLDLSHNQIPELDKDSFQDCPNLQVLNLSYNALTALPMDIFKDNENLLHLNLSHNKIASLSDEVFKDIPDVEIIDLSYNTFTVLDSVLFSQLRQTNIDLSNNPFVCSCAGKEILFAILRNENDISSIDQTKCNDTGGMEHTFMDYNVDTCSGNLGDPCSTSADCMVRNSQCESKVCICSTKYYDDNGVDTSLGLCQEKVDLDFLCDRDTACIDTHSECAGSPTRKCRCKVDYFDNQPIYMGGECILKVDLGKDCTMDAMCNATNSYCNSTKQCDCTSDYYDNNTQAVSGGACIPKLDLYASCNQSYQCGPSNSECLNGHCNCSTGYFDLTDNGQCLEPNKFYSCDDSDQSEVVFSTSTIVSSSSSCEEDCFKKDTRYYVYTSGVCLCGTLKAITSSSIQCCPKVKSECDGRTYAGVVASFASALISCQHVPLLEAGSPHWFVFSSLLPIIDELRYSFGDSQDLFSVSSSTANISHTYSYSGQFWLSIYACVKAVNVCEIASITIGVQVPSSFLTVYITGVGEVDVGSKLTNTHYTLPMGYNVETYWNRTGNGNVTMESGCPSGSTLFRTKCIKYFSTPATFASANSSCVGDGWELLKIYHMNELAELASIISGSVWLGAKKIGGRYSWISDGSKTYFDENDLAVTTNGDCIQKDSTSKLTSASCSSTAPYACIKDPSSCPDGGKLMQNGYCYLLVTSSKTWSDADSYCNSTLGGWLGNINDSETLNTITDLLTSSSTPMAWIGLNNMKIKKYYMWADDTSYDFNSSYHPSTTFTGLGGCFVTMDNKTWSEYACDIPKSFVCQYSISIDRLSVQNYVTGMSDIKLSDGQKLQQLSPIDNAITPTSSSAYTIKLFAGMPFSRQGKLRLLNFKTDNLAVGASHDVAVQLYRPECPSGTTLIQPGCANTQTSTCSSSTHSCTSGATCSDSEQLCYLSNTCKAINESCTCNSESAFAFAVKACSSNGTAPTFKLVGESIFKVTTTGAYTARVEDFLVEELDVIAVQYPQISDVIKCEQQLSGRDQTRTYTVQTDHWFTHQEFFPTTYTAVDETCFVHGVSTLDHNEELPPNLAYSTITGNNSLGVGIVNGMSRHMPLQILESVSDVSLVYPVVSEANKTAESLGTIYAEWNLDYIITVSVNRGTSVTSTWSWNGVSSTVSLSNSCQLAVQTAMNDACNASLYWSEKPFAYSTYSLNILGNTSLSIEFKNDLGIIKKSVEINTQKRIDNVSFNLNTSSLIPNTVAKNNLSLFTSSVSNGTGLSYRYSINGTSVSAPVTNSTLYHNFTELGTFNVTIQVINVLGTEEKTVQVYVKQAANLRNCKFVNTDPSVAAVNVTVKLQVQCELNSGAEVSTTWTVSDRSNNITGGNLTASSSPYTWIQSITFTNRATGVKVTAYVMDPFQQEVVSLTVDVYDAITDVSLRTNTSHVLPGTNVAFYANVSSTKQHGPVEYTFDLGDSTVVTVSSGNITHKYSTGGNFTVMVTASNGPSSYSTTTYVTVYEVVSGLIVSNDSPKATNNAAVTFTAKTLTGNFLVYRFESKLFNKTQTSPNFTHTFTSAEDYNVTVYAINNLSNVSVTNMVYIMNMGDLRISTFTVDGLTDDGCFETGITKEFEVHIIHYDIGNITYEWDFENNFFSNDSPKKTYEYSVAANYTVTVTAKYSQQSAQASAKKVVCVQERISNPDISLSSPVALPAVGPVTKSVSLTCNTGSNILYLWSTNATATGSITSQTLLVSFSTEGFYSISVNVSNEINFLVTTKVIQVIETVEGLSITCSSCIEKSGSLYVIQSTLYTFTVTSTSGSDATYSWKFGDSNTGSGVSATNTYDSLGSYTITVTATNLVTSSVSVQITVHVQTKITDITLTNYGTNWYTNNVDNTKMDTDVSKEVSFKISVSPAGMDIVYFTAFEEGSSTKNYSTDIVSHTYTTTGMKNVSVTARNEINNKTTSFTFFVIEVLTELNMKENGSLLNASGTNIVLFNNLYQYELSSPEAVENTTKISYILKENGKIVSSEVKNSIFTYTFNSVGTYVLSGYMDNSLLQLRKEFTIEVINALSGAAISASVTKGNITLGTSITFTGSVTMGQNYAHYKFFYSVAPGGEVIPAHNSSNNTVTIKPGTVGYYVVTLQVYDSVSPSVYANYSINVMVGVAGVSINYNTEHPEAIVAGNSVNFSAVVMTGTNYTYYWVAYVGTKNTTGNATTFLVTFTSQAVYNITLRVENYASSVLSYVVIYSLHEVPTYSILVPEAKYISSIDKYALSRNSNATFSSSITSSSFLTFKWSLGNTSVLSEAYQHNFTQVGTDLVVLNVSNRISERVQSVGMIIEDAVNVSNVSSCNSTFVIDISVTMIVKYTGTNVCFEWKRENLPDAVGSSTIFKYSSPGTHSINITAKNNVSEQQVNCYITTLGIIDNLQLTTSAYRYKGYEITFTLDGDYISPAVFVWVFSDGTNLTTIEPTVRHTFTAIGTYKLDVTAKNDVSSKTVSSSYIIEELRCGVPSITVDGSKNRSVPRSSDAEFSVNVDIAGCDNYTSKHSWQLYSAKSCKDPLGDSQSLPGTTNTPTLQVAKRFLPYGSQCLLFTHSYIDTPVRHNVTIDITVVKTSLVAIIVGGAFRMTPEGSELVLNGSLSYDPDEDPSTVMLYQWTCSVITNTVASTAATNLCEAVNKVTTASAILTDHTLTANDEFLFSLNVTATDREGAVTFQTVIVAASTVPIVHIDCISCNASGHIHFVNSLGVSLESHCVSGCTTSSSYEWSIIDVATSAVIKTDNTITLSGNSSKNFRLQPSKLSANKNYTFQLEVTEKGQTGRTTLTLNATSVPSSGHCTVTPYTNVVPFESLLNVTCTGVTDVNKLTSLYYKILIGPSAFIGNTYIAYYGSKASNAFYVVPIGDGDVSLSIYVVNDFGAEYFILMKTISFSQPSLPSGTTKLDYMITKMTSQMKTTAKKNSPTEMIQYCLALLNYLNQLSKDDIGTLSQRMAVRDVIMKSLSGLPLTSVESVQQMASAMALITEYPGELSTTTLDTVLASVEILKDKLEEAVQKGMDQEKIRTDTLIEAVNKVLTALNETYSSSSTTCNATVLSMFLPASDYMLSISSGVTLVNYATDDKRLKGMISKSMSFTTDLLVVSLSAQMAGEKEITMTLTDGSSLVARHVYVADANSSLQLNGVSMNTGNALDYVNYDEPSVFEVFVVHSATPYAYGLSDTMPVNTKTFTFNFHKPNGNYLSVSNLPESIASTMYLFDASVTSYEVNATGGLPETAQYDPNANMKYSSKNLEGDKEYKINIVHPGRAQVAIHIRILANFSLSSNPDAVLNAKLYKNNVPYSNGSGGNYEINLIRAHVSDLKTDHRYSTFFIHPSNVAIDDAFSIRLRSPVDLTVLIGTYYSVCEYFNETKETWDTSGCVPQDESIATVISCKCNHHTSFGGSLLVSPDQLDFTDLSEVDFSSNPIAIITCSVILFLYIVLVIAFKRMDIMDIKRISLIPLCGKDGSFKYEVTVVTGRLPRAGTTAHVGIRLIGEYGKSVRQHVSKPGAFQRNCADTFIVAYDVNLGDLRKINIWHDNSGTSPSWYLSHVIVNDLQTDQKYYFFGEKWLTLEDENGTIQKEIKVAGSHEMTKFTHRMKTATFNALADKHLWLSLFNRPAQSRFTRTQRATCCATILYVFVGVNAMWYGLLKKSNTEIGFGDFGWEEIVLALVSNVMVLPISIGLVYLFKKSRPKSNFFSNVHKPQTAQTLEIENLCGNSQGGSFESHNTGAVPYDLERESTIDSVPHTALGLHRSRHVAKTHRENTDDSLKRPSVSVTQASSRSPLWNEDGIMKWPDSVPMFDDGQDSRPSTCSTMASVPAIKQSVKAGGSKHGATRKTKDCDVGQLIAELDKLDMKDTESQSGKSTGPRKSSTTLRRPTMHKSNWGSLEDILNSDDESVADTTSSRLRKRDSTTSTAKKFNPRADPRINGNGSDWPKSRESGQSSAIGERRNGMASALRPGYYSEMTMESRDIQIPIHKEKCTLPSWCIYIGYVLCFLLSVFSIIVVILYCFKFGYSESVEWVLALILSFILSVVIIEPLKALLIAVYIVAMFKNVEQDEDDDFIDILPTFDNSNEKIKDVKFKPISGFALLQAKEEGRKIHRMKIILRQFIAYIFYLWLIMVIVYVNFRYDSYLMTKHVTQDFIAPTTSNHQNFTNITSIDEFWDWTENVFAGSLYKENITDEEHGLLLGAPRMRLIRGVTTKCEASDAAMNLGAPILTQRICHGEGTYNEDSKDYSEGWNESNSNYSWKYFTAGQLGSTHKIGHVATYGGGGYPHVLGTTLAETDTILSYLKDKGWIDLQTRAVIFEFALYSAGSDMTSMIALLAEFPLTGGVITSYEIQSQKLLWFQERSVDPLMVLEVILFLVITYSVVHIALQIRERGKAFFKDVWNWYEMLTTLMALVSVGMYIGCVVEATNTFNNLLDDLTGFTNFERVMYVHVGMRYLHAWLLFLLMYKVVRQLRFIKFMYVYEQTLSTAVGHLLGSGLIYVILLLVYAQVGYLMYGRIVSGFESVGHSVMTLIVMIRGTFDFWPMLDHHPIFSHFYVYSYYAFAYGILMAFVISILTSTYRVVKSKMYFKSTLEMQDYEMIEFMLKRFKLWAGLQKPKPAFRRVRFPGLPSISSRSSSSYSNRSSASLQSSQSLTGPQYSEVQLQCMLTRLQPTWQAVLKRMDKILALDDEEENLVKKAENEMKELNWKCRINELERQHKELLSWKSQSESAKPPAGDAKQRQSILKRLSRKDNQDRKAPATVSGAPSRTAASTPADQGNGEKASQGRRPLSDQGARVEPSTSKGRSSSSEKSKVQTFFKSIKPSKSAWNNK